VPMDDAQLDLVVLTSWLRLLRVAHHAPPHRCDPMGPRRDIRTLQSVLQLAYCQSAL
jgi:hypothetical protein